jgi:hypothetical protein
VADCIPLDGFVEGDEQDIVSPEHGRILGNFRDLRLEPRVSGRQIADTDSAPLNAHRIMSVVAGIRKR